jgi:hypothetical protein
MQTEHPKCWHIVRVILATILLCVAFNRPVVSQSSPSQPYDLYMPLIANGFSPLPPIQNGDFEQGDNGDWTVYSSADYSVIQEEYLPPWLDPHSGSWLAWMGGVPDEDSRISQGITLPSGGPVYLRYYYQVDSSDQVSCTRDWMVFLVGTTQLASMGLCEAANTLSWTPGTVDLSVYAGQAITVTFQVTTSLIGEGSSFFIDDVSLARSP